MSSARWPRSLVVRLGAATFTLMAILLLAQAALFLWASDGIASGGATQAARQLSALVASDVATVLTTDSTIDLEQRLRAQFGTTLQDIVVVRTGGRLYRNRDRIPLELLKAGERIGIELEHGREDVRVNGGGTLHGTKDPTRGDAGGPFEVTPVRIAGQEIATVVVLSKAPPFARVLRTFGPTMAIVAAIVLLVGTLAIALIVLRPAHRRLQDVEAAVAAVGAGDLHVRVPESGADEVATLAGAFNRMTEALQESDANHRQLFADISHELKTPLTSMRGYLDTLQRADIALEPDVRARYLAIVSREEQRVERLVGELLDLARLEARGVSLEREPVAVSDLFDLVAERHEQELAARHIELRRTIEPGAETVLGDPDRLEQVTLNLSANALRYVPDGGVLRLAATPEADAIRLTVHDSGPGIPAEHLTHVFDRFYKVDASRKSSGGSGLGLSLVKAIVESHGGSVSARNDNGAVFEVLLPNAAP